MELRHFLLVTIVLGVTQVHAGNLFRQPGIPQDEYKIPDLRIRRNADPCDLCMTNFGDANRCTVYIEAKAGYREETITVKCYDGNIFLGERAYTQANSRPGEDVHKMYSKDLRRTSRKLQPNSGRSARLQSQQQAYQRFQTVENDPCGVCTPTDDSQLKNALLDGRTLPDDSCSVCDGTGANSCSVREETTIDTQNLQTTVKCLEGNTLITERTLTKPNPFPGKTFTRYYTKSFRAAGTATPRFSERFDQGYCTLCQGTRATSCSVHEGTDPGDTRYIQVEVQCLDDARRVVLERTHRKVAVGTFQSKDVTPLNAPLQVKPTDEDRMDDVCRVCETTQANSCSVKEETSPDLRDLIIRVKCSRNENQVYETTYRKVNPYPGNRVERWYSQSVRRTTVAVPLGSMSQVRDVEEVEETGVNPLKEYCTHCDGVSRVDKCSVREETNPSGTQLIVIVKCLQGDTVITDRNFSKPNPYPSNQRRARWYSQSIVRTTQQYVPSESSSHTSQSQVTTTGQRPYPGERYVPETFSQTSSSHTSESQVTTTGQRSYPGEQYGYPPSDICTACSGLTSVETCAVGEETSPDNRILYLTVKCLDINENLIVKKNYQKHNTYPYRPVNRVYTAPIPRITTSQRFTDTKSNVVTTSNSNPYIGSMADYERDLLAQSCVICDTTKARTCTVGEETSLDDSNLITVVKCLDDRDQTVIERTYYKPNRFPNQKIKRWFTKTITVTQSTYHATNIPQFPNIPTPLQVYPDRVNGNHYATAQSSSQGLMQTYNTFQDHETQRNSHYSQSLSKDHGTQSNSQYSQRMQNTGDRLVYGENHMPDKPCSICQTTQANTCSVKEETTPDTKNIVTTVRCLSGNTLLMEREFSKVNPYPGSHVRRTHYESCGEEQQH